MVLWRPGCQSNQKTQQQGQAYKSEPQAIIKDGVDVTRVQIGVCEVTPTRPRTASLRKAAMNHRLAVLLSEAVVEAGALLRELVGEVTASAAVEVGHDLKELSVGTVLTGPEELAVADEVELGHQTKAKQHSRPKDLPKKMRRALYLLLKAVPPLERISQSAVSSQKLITDKRGEQTSVFGSASTRIFHVDGQFRNAFSETVIVKFRECLVVKCERFLLKQACKARM